MNKTDAGDDSTGHIDGEARLFRFHNGDLIGPARISEQQCSLKMLISCREEFELARENYREFLEIPFWRH